MKYIKLFEAFNESHTDRTAIDDLGNESEVKDAVMVALTEQYPAVGDYKKEIRDLLGGIMFSYENKSVEKNNECLEDIAGLLRADIHEVAFTIGEAIWKLDPAIVEGFSMTRDEIIDPSSFKDAEVTYTVKYERQVDGEHENDTKDFKSVDDALKFAKEKYSSVDFQIEDENGDLLASGYVGVNDKKLHGAKTKLGQGK